MALFWVNVDIGVDADTELEAECKVDRFLQGVGSIDCNTLVFEIAKDESYESLEALRNDQSKPIDRIH